MVSMKCFRSVRKRVKRSCFRQGLHRNVMRGVLAQLFKFVDLQIQVADLFPQVSFALLKSLEFRLRGIFG